MHALLSVVRKWKRRLLLAGSIWPRSQQNKDSFGKELGLIVSFFFLPELDNSFSFAFHTVWLSFCFLGLCISCPVSFASLGLNIKPISGSLPCLGPQKPVPSKGFAKVERDTLRSSLKGRSLWRLGLCLVCCYCNTGLVWVGLAEAEQGQIIWNRCASAAVQSWRIRQVVLKPNPASPWTGLTQEHQG